MSTKNEKELDAFIRQLTKDIPLEEPREQFTSTVLSSIAAAGKQSAQTVYAPVFSRASWVVISLLAIILLVIGYFSGEQGRVFPDFLSFLTESSYTKLNISLPTIANSKILLLSSLALISCVAVQIIWLKKSWSKKQVLF